MAIDNFALENKGVDMGVFGFDAKKARYQIKGDDLADLVQESANTITTTVLTMTPYTRLNKPFLYWLFPNYHLMVAINTQDLR